MKVTPHLIENARRVQRLNDTGVTLDGRFTVLGDLPYNDHGQTPNAVCSFTFALGHLLSTSGGPFITGLTEEAASYVETWAIEDYEKRVRLACERANVDYPKENA